MTALARSHSRRAARASRRVGVVHKVHRFRLLRRLSLRARVTLTFALGGLLMSALLAGATLYLTRQNLLQKREAAALDEVFDNAQQASGYLKDDPVNDIDLIVDNLKSPNDFIVHYLNPIRAAQNEWRPSAAGEFDENDVPLKLLSEVNGGESALIRTVDKDTGPVLIIGVPLKEFTGVQYYERIQLDDIQDTLRSLTYILVAAAASTAGIGAFVGTWAARRTVRPLGDVAAAAEAIAGGRLDTRLVPPADRDLASLAASFNEMAGALQERVERDARFASEVSHELRSPLMTLTASVAVLETRMDELPERAQTAVELLSSDLQRFKQLVEDLLEISRFDVGTARLELEDLNLVEFTRQAVSRASAEPVPIIYDPSMESIVILADKRRLARVLYNLVENATKYGDGTTCVELLDLGDSVQIAVEDRGPGVPIEERIVIFDRFSRGGAGGRRGSDSGVGLGLSLVTEHVHLHGGRVWVEDRADGQSGARFIVELPLDPEVGLDRQLERVVGGQP
ncbi:MAG: HAMP domain-containing sensor histidine kinase [Acidimicrobiales bacterium]